MFYAFVAFGLLSWVFRPAGTPTAKPNSEEKLSNEVLCWTDRLGANRMHHIPGSIKSESGDRSTRASLRC